MLCLFLFLYLTHNSGQGQLEKGKINFWGGMTHIQNQCSPLILNLLAAIISFYRPGLVPSRVHVSQLFSRPFTVFIYFFFTSSLPTHRTLPSFFLPSLFSFLSIFRSILFFLHFFFSPYDFYWTSPPNFSYDIPWDMWSTKNFVSSNSADLTLCQSNYYNRPCWIIIGPAEYN